MMISGQFYVQYYNIQSANKKINSFTIIIICFLTRFLLYIIIPNKANAAYIIINCGIYIRVIRIFDKTYYYYTGPVDRHRRCRRGNLNDKMSFV